jgi:hypothetical protein
MMKNHRLSNIAGAVVIALGLSTSVMANETSSSILGKVNTPAGQPAANTKVTITHIPSGTVKVVETNESGSYSARGLRVGGPYTIVIDSDEFKDQQQNNVYLEVGKPLRISTDLDVDDVERIAVTGSRVVGFTNKGSAGSWGSDDIMNAAGGNRDLKDVLRTNPLVNLSTDDDGTMSIAGSNPRFNSFTVDGVRQNDDFGLNGNGYPTQRSPISIDAIEQVSVETTPFSARNGGFSGGQINAVTKSGTNEFHGSLSWEKDSDSWAGTPKDPAWEDDLNDPNDSPDIDLDFESTTYAATLGGPIIEDKLFFFASYEKFDAPAQIEFGPDGTSAPNATDASLADYEELRSVAQSVYGVDIGTWDKQPEEKDEKVLVKLDWNINDDHRASLTYQKTEGNVTRNTTSSDYELKLSTHWYDKNENLESLAAHLYSYWSDDFSTEIKLAYKEVDTAQAPSTKAFGDVTVATASGDIAFGADKYRHGNELDNQTLSFRFLGEYLYEDHEIAFGLEYESIDVRNLFAQDSLGTWEFDSIADFANQTASGLDYANAYTNNSDDVAAEFTFENTTLFVEDSIQLTDTFILTAGLRYEQISSDDQPSFNANFFDRYAFSNSTNLDGESIFLPRIAFEWEATDNLVVRGGVGRFSGGSPNVWLSNSYSNDGVTYVTGSVNDDDLINADITKIPQSVLDSMAPGDGNVNVTDPNFKLPSDWRSSIGFDYTFAVPSFGEDWLWSSEYIYTKKKDSVFWTDLTRQQVGETTTGVPIYEAIDKLTGEKTQRYDLMLTNADDDGRSKIFTTSLSKQFDNGFGFNASYTNQDITEGTPGTSSTATSNFQYPVTTDRGSVNVGTGAYEIEHSFKLSMNYRTEFVENYATSFHLFFERHSGRPISWVLGAFRDSDFGDQGSFDDSEAYLPYIPTGADDPNVVYNGSFNYAEFSGYLDATGLSKYAGGNAPKGADRAPWVTRLDLTITQELPGFMEGHKGELFFNIRNLLNLIDSSKGQALRSQYSTTALVDYDIDDAGRYVYSRPYGGFDGNNWDTFDAEKSAWSVKMGVRYRF